MDAVNAGALTAVVEQILAGVSNVQGGETNRWVSAAEVSRHLREAHGIDLHWRTIDATLAKDRAYAKRRKRAGRWEYVLLGAGRSLIASVDSAVTFVDPEAAVQATLKLHELLAALAGPIAVCDPYFDTTTLEHLEACPRKQKIRVLTMNVKESGPLRRVIAAARAASYDIEVRVVGSRVLHDRYIIDDARMLILGTSLNGFGKKQSFVISAGPDVRRIVLEVFEGHWAGAAPWP